MNGEIREIKYSGWVGNNNIGDEAIYFANKQLFGGFDIIYKDYASKKDFCLFGGGTKFPIKKNTSGMDCRFIASIGVGVKDPEFRNRKYSSVDIGYYLGKAGIGHILNQEYIQYGLRPLAHVFDSVTVRDHYLTKEDFNRISSLDYVGVRGPLSKKVLDQYGVDCTVTGDTALVLSPDEYVMEDRKTIAITLRATGYKWDSDDEYINAIIDFCNSLEDYKFKLIPFYPKDIPLHLDLRDKIQNSKFIDYCTVPDVNSILTEYAECDIVIGERLHANVLSACTFTPFISIEYRPKSLDFAKSINMDQYNVRINNVSKQQLKYMFKGIKNEGGDLKTMLSGEVEKKRKHLEECSNQIIQLYEAT